MVFRILVEMFRRGEVIIFCFNIFCEIGSGKKDIGSGEKWMGKLCFRVGVVCGFVRVFFIFYFEMLKR